MPSTREGVDDEEKGCCLSCMSRLPCFRPYRGDETPLRDVVTQAPLTEDADLRGSHEFMSNYVRTTRYRWWNFLPVNLYEQFQKAANFYFLIMAAITAIPGISTIPLYSTATPLCFVLGVTAIKDALEDYKRHKNDQEVNAREVQIVLPGGESNSVAWSELEVGHLVKLHSDERIPADMIVISTSQPSGECAIQTASLDGETNLKTRQAVKATSGLDLGAISKEGLVKIKCEQPNTQLYNFEGQLRLQKETYPLDHTQMLLRGAIVKETKFVYGVVVYTGDQTKMMLNNDPPRFKRSHMDIVMNTQMYFIFLLQFILIATVTILDGWFYINKGTDHWYLGLTKSDTSSNNASKIILRDFFAFYVLFSVMVPISLYVTIEITRLLQALLINVDNRMYDPEDKKLAIARATTLSEELGQVQYIFSDKTGTLTSNQMAFEKCSINGRLYGDKKDLLSTARDSKESHESKATINDSLLDKKTPTADYETTKASTIANMTNVEIDGDPKYCNMRSGSLLSALVDGDKSARDYVLALALCHTVNSSEDPERPGNYVYQGESTDEIALVTMASFHGVRFKSRNRKDVSVILPWAENSSQGEVKESIGSKGTKGAPVQFKILHILAFTSDRKRMSVIVQFPDGTIRLLTKGADNVMKKIADKDDKVNSSAMWKQTEDHLHNFSRDGLRVMLVGQRTISDEEYQSWNQRYLEASQSFADAEGNRKEKMDKVAGSVEQGIRILGITAIEDKLQDGVPRTLALLKKASIKIWVLTGDKQDTAVNIGKSCGLIGWGYELFYLRDESMEGGRLEMEKTLRDLEKGTTGGALMVSGDVIEVCLAPANREIFGALINHPRSRVVIASRMSPRQKARVVTFVKTTLGVVTLAVGDGANDVSMIRAAHVGVGLRGKEGMQAANSSDFALSKFRFLTQLLLVHGNLSYERNSTLINYFFYKNLLVCVQQLYFVFASGFSSEEVFDGYMLNTFNLMWTALPILLHSMFDRPFNVDELLEFPQLYLPGLRGEYFNSKVFWYNQLQAFIHGSIIFAVIWITMHDALESYWACSVATYTAVVIVANTKMAMLTSAWLWFTAPVIILTVLVYLGAIFLYCGPVGFNFSPHLFGVIGQIMSQPMFYLATLWVTGLIAMQDVFYYYIKRTFFPSLKMLVQECRGDVNVKQELLAALNEKGGTVSNSKWTNQNHGLLQGGSEDCGRAAKSPMAKMAGSEAKRCGDVELVEVSVSDNSRIQHNGPMA